MKPIEYWYEVDDSGYRFSLSATESGKTFAYDLSKKDDRRWFAEECAQDYHWNHDGWEASWPMKISIAETEDGPIIETFEVEREAEPVFYAYSRTTRTD
jgi:hypothetical protein